MKEASPENQSSESRNFEKKVKETIKKLEEHSLVKNAFLRLQKELPKDLVYHNAEHTKTVLDNVVKLAVFDNLSDSDIELLGIAAAYHDLGYTERKNKNEVIGAQIVVDALKNSGTYTDEQIQYTKESIEDTEVEITENGLNQREKGRNKLSDYLLDADLSSFGSEDFSKKTMLVAREFGVDIDDEKQRHDYLKDTLKFLENHKWKSEAGKKLFSEQKDKNIEWITNEIKG